MQPYPDITTFNASSFDDILANPVFGQAYGPYTDAFQLIAKYHYTQQSYIATDDHLGWLSALVGLESDFAFFSATVKEAQILLNSSTTVFLYSFDYLSNQTDWYPIYQGNYIVALSTVHYKMKSSICLFARKTVPGQSTAITQSLNKQLMLLLSYLVEPIPNSYKPVPGNRYCRLGEISVGSMPASVQADCQSSSYNVLLLLLSFLCEVLSGNFFEKVP